MTKGSIHFFIALLVCGTAWGQSDVPAFMSKHSIGVTASYSPTSGHVLIGEAEQRRVWTTGVEYTLRMLERKGLRIEYRSEVAPLFQETDPTAVAYEETIFGNRTITPISPPVRVVTKSHAPVGADCISPEECVPIYLIYGTGEATYGMAFSPIGARAAFFLQHRIQPTFETDIGAIISSRAIPVNSAAKVNYQFSFGPGVQFHFSRGAALRLEYVFRHISNANSGPTNPGIDQGVFRMSLCHYW